MHWPLDLQLIKETASDTGGIQSHMKKEEEEEEKVLEMHFPLRMHSLIFYILTKVGHGEETVNASDRIHQPASISQYCVECQ